MVIDSPWLYIVLEHSRSPSTQDDYSSYRWFKSAAYRHCVIGLLSVNIDRQAGWCVHYWHCVFIRCVGGYSLYVILQLLGLFIIARGLGWVFWGLGGGVQVGGGGGGIFNWNKISANKCSWGLKMPKKKIGGGGGGVFFSILIYFFQKCFWGSETHAKKKISGGGFWGVWGAPRPHPGVAWGRKTIHFFLWPWHVTG